MSDPLYSRQSRTVFETQDRVEVTQDRVQRTVTETQGRGTVTQDRVGPWLGPKTGKTTMRKNSNGKKEKPPVCDSDSSGNEEETGRKRVTVEERNHIVKHCVGYESKGFDDIFAHAKHAETVQKEKKRSKATSIMYTGEQETLTFVVDKPRRSGKGKGGYQGKRDYRKLGQDEDKQECWEKGLCFICRKAGHLMAECPKKRGKPDKSKGKKREERAAESSDSEA
uniref:CCHC-type domain-containing protein n=1 Tax=Knipowitschia caucasica TaxID=637954 RepID=A0AAV2LVV6_KNICA